MNESEAKDFIANEVSRLLWQRLAIIGSLFGIANVIAFVALLNSITTQAHSIAEQQVKSSAADFAKEKLEKFTEVTEAAKERISTLDKSYVNLYIKVGETNAGLESLQSSKKTLEKSLSDLAAESTKLRTSIEVLKTSDITRVAQVVTAINTLPVDSKALVTEWKSQIVSLQQALSQHVADKGNPHQTNIEQISEGALKLAETKKYDNKNIKTLNIDRHINTLRDNTIFFNNHSEGWIGITDDEKDGNNIPIPYMNICGYAGYAADPTPKRRAEFFADVVKIRSREFFGPPYNVPQH